MYLYLISENLYFTKLIFEICIPQNWFFNLIFYLDFLSISNLIFTACLACKNQVRNRKKSSSKIEIENQIREIEILEN